MRPFWAKSSFAIAALIEPIRDRQSVVGGIQAPVGGPQGGCTVLPGDPGWAAFAFVAGLRRDRASRFAASRMSIITSYGLQLRIPVRRQGWRAPSPVAIPHNALTAHLLQRCLPSPNTVGAAEYNVHRNRGNPSNGERQAITNPSGAPK